MQRFVRFTQAYLSVLQNYSSFDNLINKNMGIINVEESMNMIFHEPEKGGR